MSKSKVLRVIGFLSFSFLAFSVYLQNFRGVLPCSLCVVQRYAYCALLVFCILARFSFLYRIASFLAFLSALGGLVASGFQVFFAYSSSFQCDNFSIVNYLIKLPTTRWLPFLFKPLINCSNDTLLIFSLSIPMWSLIFFSVFTLALFFVAIRRRS